MKQLNIKAFAEKIKCRAESDIKENNICGVSIAVINPDETLYKGHFGTLSAEDKSPLNDRTLFRMASMTKLVTAVSIMSIYDKGIIEIDDPVLKYLPQFEGRYIVKMTQALCYL